MRRWCAATVLGMAAFAAPAAARASDPAAEQLYEEGRQAAEQKDWAVACERFRRSQELEPAPGTVLNLANCEENQGHLRDAREHFELAARLFRPGDERIAYAQQRASAVERRLARLVVRVHPGAPAGTSVELDGAVLAAQTLGRMTLVDPGEHVLVLNAPGRAATRSTIRLGEGESRELDMSAGPPQPSTEASVAVTTTVLPPASTAPSPAGHDVPPGGSSSLRAAGYVGLGVGAAGLALGTVAGLVTLNAKNTSNAHCNPDCDPTGLGAEHDGKTWSTVSTVAFIVGGVSAVAGVSLLLVAPSRNGAISAQASTGGASLLWQTSF